MYTRLSAKQRSILVAVFACATVAFSALGQRASQPTPVSDSKEWSLVGGDLTNARHSHLAQINRTTVKDLGGAWVSEPFEGGSQSRSTPVVKDGLMFVTAGPWIYALDAKTGNTVWKIQSDGRPVNGINNMSTTAHSAMLKTDFKFPAAFGVGVGGGLIYIGMTGGEVRAFDQRTGTLVWTTQLGDVPAPRGQDVSGAPLYVNGKVIVGLANADYGLRGRVISLDAKTGRQLWEFFTVPSPGERGHETWQQDNDTWKRGGGGVWLIGCVDTDLNMVYFGTGNAVPMAGGEVRGGDNLFTDSVVALDLDSGKLRWHYQLVHHDLWDADIAVSPLLYETKDGKGTKAIAALRPDGYLFLLDRQTGKPIMQVEERPMPQDSFAKTSPTQPYPIGADGILPSCDELSKSAKLPPGYVFGCTFSPVSFNSNVIAPAVGVRVAPMAYSPQTGFFYAAAANGLVSRRRVSEDPYFVAVSGPRIPGLMSYGYFTAIDSRTNKLAWKKALSPAVVGRSGVLSTEGGLVFRAAGDGNVEAYDAQNGENLWRFQIGVGGGPLATYQIDGEEYVALTAGPRVWAFKLKGQVPPISTPVASQTSTVAEGDWFTGPIEETTFIETASMTADIGTLGKRYGLDEHAFSPTRARVKVGARVRWINNGRMIHTVVAHDGSWTTGQMSPAQMVTLVFDKPGTYSYTCKDHPWALAQIIVVPDNEIANPTQATAIPASSANGDNRGFYTVDQARRGQTQYDAQCVGCHADNGGGQATALKGQSFIQNWRGRPLKDLYAKISTTMPRANPGGLSLQTYLDITAYLLQTNDFPSGDRDLTNTPSVFERALTH